jgi:hypothetical protein
VPTFWTSGKFWFEDWEWKDFAAMVVHDGYSSGIGSVAYKFFWWKSVAYEQILTIKLLEMTFLFCIFFYLCLHNVKFSNIFTDKKICLHNVKCCWSFLVDRS